MLKSISSAGLCLIWTSVRQAQGERLLDGLQRADPRGQPRGQQWRGLGDGGHARLLSGSWSASGFLLLSGSARLSSSVVRPVVGPVAGQGQEDLVQRGAAQGQLGDHHARVVEPPDQRGQQRRIGRRGGDGGAGNLPPGPPGAGRAAQASRAARRPSAVTSATTTGRSAGSAPHGQRLRPRRPPWSAWRAGGDDRGRDPLPRCRAASWSASSRYWVVSRTVTPLPVSSRTMSHVSLRLQRVQAGGGLIEEQHARAG